MQSLRILRRKIRAVKNIRQITQAMKMVAAARLRRVQDRAVRGMPYAKSIQRLIEAIAPHIAGAAHPLLKPVESNIAGVVVVTGDKGLCGAYNANVIREATEFCDELKLAGKIVRLYCIGRKGATYFLRRHWDVKASMPQISVRQPYEDARELSDDLMRWYLSGEICSLHFVYTSLVGTSSFRVMRRKLLPIEADATIGVSIEYIFEPPVERLLKELLPRYFEVQVYQMLLEALACEQIARVQAMAAASDNATEMLEKLTIELNKVRQWSITRELLEITAAAEALRRYWR